MVLRSGGISRGDASVRALAEWLSYEPRDASYWLYAADYADEVTQVTPVPARASVITTLASDLEPWAAVDLLGAARTVARLHPEAERIILVTDGEDPFQLLDLSEGDPSDLPSLIVLRSGEIPPTDASRIAMPRLSPSQVAAASPRAEQTSVGSAQQGQPDRQLPRVRLTDRPFVRTWAAIARIPFLLATAMGAVAAVLALMRHRERRAKVVAHNASPPGMTLEIRSPDGKQTVDITRYPASPLTGITLEARGTAVWMNASVDAKVNGSKRAEHEISERDIIRAGNARVVIAEVERRKRIRPPRNNVRLYGLAPAFSLVTAVTAFALPTGPVPERQPVVVTQAGEGTSEEPQTEVPLERPDPTQQANRQQRTRQLGTLPTATRYPAVPVTGKLDFLLIHSHPDDESIDFGGIVSRMTSAGAQGAAVILTDGRAGRDQYPWRITSDRYPPYDLSGAAFEEVRIQETREALGWLGVGQYVRFGLTNHPYNSLEEELSATEVRRRWDEIAPVVDYVASIIEATRPTLILSPDVPGFAREHFEHDAAGTIVAQAIARVRAAGAPHLLAHIRSIDPYQSDEYADLVRLDAWAPAEDGTIPRLNQARALLAHRTQRDASAIAIEDRLALRYELFRIDTFAGTAPPSIFDLDWITADPDP